MGITWLKPVERTTLDRNRIVELGVRLGPIRMEELVSRTMEDLAVLMAQISRAHDAGRIDRMGDLADRVAQVASEIGLTRLAGIARDIRTLTRSYDATALAAVTGRLTRVGEAALFSQIDAEDMQI